MFASMLRRSAATARRAAPTARFAGLRSGAMLAGAVGVGAGVAAAAAQWAPVAQCSVSADIAAIQKTLSSIEATMGGGVEAGTSTGFGNYTIAHKTAVVTGAASGIGYAIAELFASKGAKVHVLDINLTTAKNAAAEISAKTGNPHVTGWAVNVTDAGAVDETFEAIVKGDGRIDMLINNAGVAAVGSVTTTTSADMDKLYAVNIKGVFHCLQAGVKHMLADGEGGAIVNLASIASIYGLRDRFAYGMSKGAVLTMTYSVATDYITQGIRCNAVAPARVHTPFVDGFIAKNYPGKEKEVFKKLSDYQPIGRMGEPREIAGLVLYLCSPEAAFVTGNCYPIDGGVTYCADGRAQ